MALSPVLSTTVLGKRKAVESLVLHLASSPEPSASYAPSDSEFDIPDVSKRAKPSTGRPILVNGSLVVNTKRRYQCTYERCEKAYTKPSRLEEHERSHTGDVSLSSSSIGAHIYSNIFTLASFCVRNMSQVVPQGNSSAGTCTESSPRICPAFRMLSARLRQAVLDLAASASA